MSLALLADAPCGDCGALLDQGQRYCVHCGRRRPDVEEPAIAWLATTRDKPSQATRATTLPVRNPLALPALVLAILPVAVGIGVLVGHSGRGADAQLLEALRSQKAPIVRVGNVAGAGAPAAASLKAKKSAAKAKKSTADKTGGKVVAKTRYGVAHEVSGYKPSASKVQSDKKLVEQINKSIGKNYLDAQRNLPDTIVVTPGSGTTTAPGAQGRGD
ncbi:MAG: hypothetical protein QOJ98_1312 [Acidobacteriota bacterium]|nr:hypothetical protein [Acidobacteriota bacterium]